MFRNPVKFVSLVWPFVLEKRDYCLLYNITNDELFLVYRELMLVVGGTTLD